MTRVLIVDDCRDTTFTMAQLLGRFGHETESARGGEEALKLASVFQPEVVFLDLWMPLMDGYELSKRLRQVEGLESIRIVAMSGANPEPNRNRQAGFDFYLLKPASLDQMLEAMGDHQRTLQTRRR